MYLLLLSYNDFIISYCYFFVDTYNACKLGDLAKVKNLMPGLIVMINECKKEYMTLLMM